MTEACQAGEMDETFRHHFRDPSLRDYLYVHTCVDSNLGYDRTEQDKGTIAKPELK